MLDSMSPISFIITSIFPEHLAVAISHIELIVSFVDIAAGPGKNSITVFFVVSVATLIMIIVAWTSSPDSLTLPQSIHKISFEKAAIKPEILSIS